MLQLFHSFFNLSYKLSATFQEVLNEQNLQRVLTAGSSTDKTIYFAQKLVQNSSSSLSFLKLNSSNSIMDFLHSVICNPSILLGQLVDDFFAATITAFFTLNAIVEFLGWIADANLISLNAARWFRYSLYCWASALILGILRHARRIHSKGWTKQITWPDRLILIGLLADFICALNSILSIKVKRNLKKLTLLQSALLSLVASLIGFYKTF